MQEGDDKQSNIIPSNTYSTDFELDFYSQGTELIEVRPTSTALPQLWDNGAQIS